MKLRSKLSSVVFVLLAFTLFQSNAFANPNDVCHLELTDSELMKTTRIDRHVPCACKPFRVSQFKDSDIEYFIGGINSTKGADDIIDLDRREATTLWNSLDESKSESSRLSAKNKLAKDAQLLGYYEDLLAIKDLHGFDFVNEGEILEALSILDLEEKYPTDQYFATGGIMYFALKGQSTTGELDLVVFERDSCKVVLVGEAKLSRSTSKAREQLARFRGFLHSQGQK
jgi:hypothetical protein